MSCSPFELKDYFLKELPVPQQREVEAHVNGCQVCREELDRLQLTGAALSSLRDEEMPQRIAFVSDKIFEPSPWRRGWAAFWGSGARLGFASAAMLSMALIVSAVMRTAPVGQVSDLPKAPVVVQPVSDTEIQTRIDTAVAKAVAQIQSRQTQQAAQLVADLEDARRKLLLAAAEYDMSQKRTRVYTAGAYDMPPLPKGENK
jgi:hypothetical protein